MIETCRPGKVCASSPVVVTDMVAAAIEPTSIRRVKAM